jgi:hypothetical protein
MKISTPQLIDRMFKQKNHVFEASLNNGFFNAMHFLRWGGRKIFDCGIDSADISWAPNEFNAFYEQAFWQIDQII